MKLQSAAPAPKVIVVSPWYGGNEGGVAVVTESLVQSLVQEGTPCAAIVMAPDGLWPRYTAGQSGEEVVTLCIRDSAASTDLRSKVGAGIRRFIATRAFRKLLPEKSRKCVVHLHYSMPEYSFFTELCGKLRIPMITTFHGSDLTVNLDDARTREVTRRMVTSSSAVTAVSAALRQTTLSMFPEIERHTVVVHNAVPPDFVAALQNVAPRARDLDVLYVGNLIPRKGVDVLLHAWALVTRSFASARLTIAGGGEDAAMLEGLARELRIDDSVTFLGRQRREVLPELYRRAKVLVVPSRAEPLGVVVLEGLLSGAAVVATETGGIPEIITNNEHGLLVPVDDSSGLARGIIHMLENEADRLRMAAAGHERVREHFSSQGIAKQYRAIYQRAVGA